MRPHVHRFSDGQVPLAVLALACAALTACDRTTGSGVVGVGDFPRLVAEEDARIGDMDDPDVGFSRIGGVDLDDEGNVYVVESLLAEIRVYTPEGELLRRIGRRGEGPGEFQGPPRFGVMGDTVWAIDLQANRITLFDRSGALLSTGAIQPVMVPIPSGMGHVLPLRMRADGLFTSHLLRVSFAQDAPAVDPTDSIPVPMVLFHANGTVADTIGWAGRPPPRMWRPPAEQPSEPELVEVAGRRFFAPTPPTTLPSWLPLADGYVLVETPLPTGIDDAAFSVTRIGLHGDTLYHRTFHYAPVRYTPEDLDSIAAWAARGDPRGMSIFVPGRPPPDDWEVIAVRLRAAMDFPEWRLPLDFPRLGADEGVWMRWTDQGSPETRTWLVLDPQGDPRGRLELPAGHDVRWSRGDTIWAVDTDDLGVPWLVRLRVRRDTGSLDNPE